jgi:hypothetical protein
MKKRKSYDRKKAYDRKYEEHGPLVLRLLATNAANARWKKK